MRRERHASILLAHSELAGGSTIVTVFPENTVKWDDDLLTNGQASTETLVKVGMKVGKSVRGQAVKPTKSGSGSSAASVAGQ